MYTLALDPGRRFTGWSLFYHKEMTACGVSKLPKDGSTWGLGRVCDFHWGAMDQPSAHRVAVEEMKLTKARTPTLIKAIAVGNDVLELQAIGAYIAGRSSGELTYVPHFKCPKEVTRARVYYLLTRPELDILEKALDRLGKKDDDLFDSLAHGLRAVGRL